MPLSLGLGAAGKAASAFGGSGKGGPQATKTQTGSESQLTQGSQTGTNTPNLNPLMAGFQSSLVPALASQYQKAQTPVYGQQQIAQIANQGDAATKAASDALSSNLARRGALDSGAQAAGQTSLQMGNEANTVGFENQIPLLNYQNEMQQTGNVLGLAEGLTGKALTTNVGSGTGEQAQTGTSSNLTSVNGPSTLSSILGSTGAGLTNAAGLGGLGGAGKGGGAKGAGSANSAGGASLTDLLSSVPGESTAPGYVPIPSPMAPSGYQPPTSTDGSWY